MSRGERGGARVRETSNKDGNTVTMRYYKIKNVYSLLVAGRINCGHIKFNFHS